jgi:hypothetical protein
MRIITTTYYVVVVVRSMYRAITAYVHIDGDRPLLNLVFLGIPVACMIDQRLPGRRHFATLIILSANLN